MHSFVKKAVVTCCVLFALSGCAPRHEVQKRPAKWPVIKVPTIVQKTGAEIEADRRQRQSAKAEEEQQKLQAEHQRLAAMPTVSAEYFGNDLRDVLTEFAEQTEVPIVYDAFVEGEVFGTFEEVPLEVALDRVLFSGGYEFREMHGAYYISSPDPENSANALRLYISKTLRTHLPAADILAHLNAGLRNYIGTTESMPHVLTISAPPRILAQIEKDISQIDSLLKQIVVDVYVIDISFEESYKIGTALGDFDLVGDGTVDLARGLQTEYSSTIMGQIFSTIQYLWQNGAVELKANPKVVTLDGHPATIEVALDQRFPILTGNVSFPQIFIEEITTGTTLNVTPHLLPDDYVLMNIKPEISDVVGRVSQSNDAGGQQSLPIVSRRTIESTLKVRLGETIIIGGLKNKFLRHFENKVPGLGDIPLIDFAFNNQNGTSETREVLVLLTPRLTSGGAPPDDFTDMVLPGQGAGSGSEQLSSHEIDAIAAPVTLEATRADTADLDRREDALKAREQAFEERAREQQVRIDQQLADLEKQKAANEKVLQEQLMQADDARKQDLQEVQDQMAAMKDEYQKKVAALEEEKKQLSKRVRQFNADQDDERADIEAERKEREAAVVRARELEEENRKLREDADRAEKLSKDKQTLQSQLSEAEKRAAESSRLETELQEARLEAAREKERAAELEKQLNRTAEEELSESSDTPASPGTPVTAESNPAEHPEPIPVADSEEELTVEDAPAAAGTEEEQATEEPLQQSVVEESAPADTPDSAAVKEPSTDAESKIENPFTVTVDSMEKSGEETILRIMVRKGLRHGVQEAGSVEIALTNSEGLDEPHYGEWTRRSFSIRHGIELPVQYRTDVLKRFSEITFFVYSGTFDRLIGKFVYPLPTEY